MITGTVSQNRAYVGLLVRSPNGQEGTVEFVLDTGFTGVTTLPAAACSAFGLPVVRLQPARLADGSRIVLDVYEATLMWDGSERLVEVLAMDGAPLLGMALLNGSDLRMRVTNGGLLTITPIPQPP